MDKVINNIVEIIRNTRIEGLDDKPECRVRYGDPLFMIIDELPMITVYAGKTSGITRSTGSDNLSMSVIINVITSPMLFWGDDNTKRYDEEWLVRIVGETMKQSNGGYKYSDKSVLGLLRKNHLLGDSFLGLDNVVDGTTKIDV
jgi:hypothetical protein